MSFFSWLSNKPTQGAPAQFSSGVMTKNTRSSPAALPQSAPAAKVLASAGGQTSPLSVERKVKRHARREQLYVAIRESMTRAGMLSATYKFKVLSLDQNGNQFLVMMDVAAELSASAKKLSHTEEILMQTAKAGYGITVTAVYWRVDPKTVAKPVAHSVVAAPASVGADVLANVANGVSSGVGNGVGVGVGVGVTRGAAAAHTSPADTFVKTQANAPYNATFSQLFDASFKPPFNAPFDQPPTQPLRAPLDMPASTSNTQSVPAARAALTPAAMPARAVNPAKPKNDPMLEAEVAAFKRALSAAAPATTAMATTTAVAGLLAAPDLQAAVKTTGVLKSYTLITGFEDTEIPDAAAMPALSATQYGELN